MRNSGKLVAVLVLVVAISVGQSLVLAAPVTGASQATTHSSNPGLFAHFLDIMGAIWGNAGVWGDAGIWGCPGGRC